MRWRALWRTWLRSSENSLRFPPTFAGLGDLRDPAALARLRGREYVEETDRRSRKKAAPEAPAAPAVEAPVADAPPAATPASQ